MGALISGETSAGVWGSDSTGELKSFSSQEAAAAGVGDQCPLQLELLVIQVWLGRS